MLCIALAMQADDVTKNLSPEGEDVVRIDASKVQKITFSGDQVTVKYNDGTPDATLDMGTVVLDFSNTTGIEERIALAKKAGLQGKKVYDLKGKLVGNDATQLKKGVYVIDGKKVIIK